jgi:signal peptide peptidase SppA
MSEPVHTRKCLENHMGLWAIEARWFMGAVAAVKADTFILPAPSASPPGRGYVNAGGVAVLDIEGPLMKFDSKYGGTNTVRVRQALRAAAADDAVGSIMVRIDSPGGHVAGTKELADDVKAVDAVKPVFAYAEDLMASAAYWIGSQARRVFANDTAMVGSIGVFSVVWDTSKAADMQGVKVHVISTGEHKGSFADGTPVTPEQLAEVQRLIDGTNDFFLAAIKEGREMTPGAVKAVADGRVWLAKEAKALGLIDGISSFEAALDYARGKGKKTKLMQAEQFLRLAD